MTTIALVIGALVMVAAFFGWALARVSAQSDRDARRAHQKRMLMRYQGGDRACSVCGEPTAYSLKGVPTHPTCRRDVA